MKNLNKMKSKELKEMAKELGVKNWWSLKKNDLINEIAIAIGDKEDQGEEVNVDEIVEDAIETTNDESTEETTQNDQNNGWELIAKKQLKNAYDYIVGANENAVLASENEPGHMTQEEFNEWIQKNALDEVYHEAITTQYHEDSCGGAAPSEMRFAGKDFCIKYLKKLFKADNYDINPEIKPTQKGHSAPKRGALLAFNGKEQNICAWAKELGISPNTLYGRIYKMNWTIERAFTTPARSK